MLKGLVHKLLKEGGFRKMDTATELRIRLHCTCRLPFSGVKFYHELHSPRAEQILSATLSGDGQSLDIVLFTDRLDNIEKHATIKA